MKICIDIQPAIAQRAGIGRYTKLLVEHLPLFANNDQLTLFYFDYRRRGMPFEVAHAQERPFRLLPGRFIQKAWKTISWPPFDWLAGRADIYHFTNFIRPPLASRHAASIATIHDVSFLRHPEAAEPRNLDYLNRHIHKTVCNVDAIITISNFSANEIATLLSVPREKIFPIYPGINLEGCAPARPLSSNPTRSRFCPARPAVAPYHTPYLLTVGTIEPRKNIPFLIELFEQLPDRHYDLVIAGMRGWKYEPILERIQNSSRRSQIHYLEYVSDSELATIYRQAALFVFPSLYEGFGFPPLEAMAYGTPVVSSAAGSLAEVLGHAAVVIPGYDHKIWIENIMNILDDKQRHAKLCAQGLAHVRQYTWQETARKTWDVYRSLR